MPAAGISKKKEGKARKSAGKNAAKNVVVQATKVSTQPSELFKTPPTTTNPSPQPQMLPTMHVILPAPTTAGAYLAARAKEGKTDGTTHPCFTKSETMYLSNLSEAERDELIKKVHMHRPVTVPLLFRVAESNLPNKGELVERLRLGCEGPKFENYVENALRLPFGVCDHPPDADDLPSFLHNAVKIMDEEIYGQKGLKDETIKALCGWATNPDRGSFVLGIEGPPGVGKTCFAKALGRIMGRSICSVDLGGLTDVSVLTGHSYSYESSRYGELAQCLIKAKSCSPIIVLDEVDKLGDSVRAQEVVSLLIHLTDPSSNADIQDRYFQAHNLSLDFSKACFVFTMNDRTRVSSILLDRLTMVRMKTPTVADKIQIARQFLIPREVQRLGCGDLRFDAEAIAEVIRSYSSDESGVRDLSRAFRSIVETLNVARRGGSQTLRTVELDGKFSPDSNTVSSSLVEQILHERRPRKETGAAHMYV